METAKPYISAVILSYNSEETLAQTIESALNQQCSYPFEILIGDDCSKDNSREICLKYQEQYPDKIRLLFYEKNKGVVKNWFTLIQEAKGKYIVSCAGDDYWQNPDKMQMQVDYLEANPDYGLVYTDYDQLNSQTGKITKSFLKSTGKKCPEGAGLIREIYRGHVPIRAVTVCLRRELFLKHIPIEDYYRLQFPIEDWPTWLILSQYCKIGYQAESTSTFRKGHESISNPLQYEKIEKRFKAEQVMYKYVSEMFPEDLHYDEKNYQNYIDTILLNLSYKKNDFESAGKYAKRLMSNDYKSRKVSMARNKLLFKLFVTLQKMKAYFS